MQIWGTISRDLIAHAGLSLSISSTKTASLTLHVNSIGKNQVCPQNVMQRSWYLDIDLSNDMSARSSRQLHGQTHSKVDSKVSWRRYLVGCCSRYVIGSQFVDKTVNCSRRTASSLLGASPQITDLSLRCDTSQRNIRPNPIFLVIFFTQSWCCWKPPRI